MNNFGLLWDRALLSQLQTGTRSLIRRDVKFKVKRMPLIVRVFKSITKITHREKSTKLHAIAIVLGYHRWVYVAYSVITERAKSWNKASLWPSVLAYPYQQVSRERPVYRGASLDLLQRTKVVGWRRHDKGEQWALNDLSVQTCCNKNS